MGRADAPLVSRVRFVRTHEPAALGTLPARAIDRYSVLKSTFDQEHAHRPTPLHTHTRATHTHLKHGTMVARTCCRGTPVASTSTSSSSTTPTISSRAPPPRATSTSARRSARASTSAGCRHLTIHLVTPSPYRSPRHAFTLPFTSTRRHPTISLSRLHLTMPLTIPLPSLSPLFGPRPCAGRLHALGRSCYYHYHRHS